jgi:hypothetical protein
VAVEAVHDDHIGCGAPEGSQNLGKTFWLFNRVNGASGPLQNIEPTIVVP